MPGVKASRFVKTNPVFEQACVLTLDTCLELYNASLQERRDAYQINHVSLNYNFPIGASFPASKPPPGRCRRPQSGASKTFCAALRRRSTTSFAASRQVKNRTTQIQGKAFFDSLSILRAVSVSKATNCT
ncbi:MAG: hypothetical protein IPO77_00535 [Acidobacteria bacterium]|nr:hypothetical protein [Acidobacteriota bacterium]